MKKLTMTGFALLMLAIASCSEDTGTLGNSLTQSIDRFVVDKDTFDVDTWSMHTDSVLSRSIYTYLGRIKDPETSTYITSDFMTQFNILENNASGIFPTLSYMTDLDDMGKPVADSCFINVLINAYQGDSLASMKVQVAELDRPVPDGVQYYTDFNPEEHGFLRDEDTGGLRQDKVYSVADQELSDSLRAEYRKSTFYEYIHIPLNHQYKAKSGRVYKNYGTYVMQMYYDHPEYFKNSLTFRKNVCPGFNFKTTDGAELMIEVAYVQLVIHYHYSLNGNTVKGTRTLNSTEEVLSTTHIENDKESIQKLEKADTCTYLKTPSGIFTVVRLPVDQIKLGKSLNSEHVNDSITSAKITFRRLNPINELSEVVLEEPTSLLLVERDSLYTFFENRNVADNASSFVATFNSTHKTYTFNNISALLNKMWVKRNKSAHWNEAVLVPVNIESSAGTSGSTTTSVSNEMNINSVRLIGGSANRHKPVRISVIYNKTGNN